MPGATALTRRPSGATSRAAACVSSRTAPLEASYTVIGPVEAVNADVEQTVTMLPRPRGAIARTAAWTTKKTPRTLTAISPSYVGRLDLGERLCECDSCGGHDGPERGLGVDRRDDLTDPGDVGDIELDRAGRTACGAKRGSTRLTGCAVDVGDDDVVAPTCEGLGDRPADAVGAPDDEAAAGRLSGCRWHR